MQLPWQGICFVGLCYAPSHQYSGNPPGSNKGSQESAGSGENGHNSFGVDGTDDYSYNNGSDNFSIACYGSNVTAFANGFSPDPNCGSDTNGGHRGPNSTRSSEQRYHLCKLWQDQL
jgi:hypothetical protein